MKTNHRRGYVENRDERAEYTTLYVWQATPDGGSVRASARGPRVDHCRGKHGAARDRRGAKKYVHSRVRRRTRDWLRHTVAEELA